MPVLLIDLLERVPKGVEGRVRAARDRARSVLRDAIRAECRLAMRTDADDAGVSAQVPIEVSPGYPEALRDVTFPDELLHVLLLSRFRRSLAEAASGVNAGQEPLLFAGEVAVSVLSCISRGWLGQGRA